MATVNTVTVLGREVLGRGNPKEDVSVKFVEEYDPEKLPLQVPIALKAIAVLHPSSNPHKVLEMVASPRVVFPDNPIARGAVEVAALDELAAVLSKVKADKELERARALVAANPLPVLPDTPDDLFDAKPTEAPEPPPEVPEPSPSPEV
jgi:hypothetical protein